MNLSSKRSGNGFPRSSSNRRLASKLDLLSKYQDKEENENNDDDIFGEPYDDLFQKKLEEPYSLENDFHTLKLSNSPKFNMHTPKFNSSINSHKVSNDILKVKHAKSRPSLSPHNLISKYTESPEQESFDDFLELASDNDVQSLSMNLEVQLNKGISPKEIQLSPSPTSMSTSSPKRRKSLSEYSEDTNDTDVTSQFDDEDFDDLDDIFGNEESGIYRPNERASKKSVHQSIAKKVNNHLHMKQKKLQDAAELEELELYKRYNRIKNDNEEVNTLKLKDFKHYNNFEEDAIENEKTINYEYTKDDFEVFEEGFDLDGPIDFDTKKLKQYSDGKNDFGLSSIGRGARPTITSKMSMPNFRKSGSSNNFKNIKKFKSSINLEKELQDDFNEHPVFNNNNRIIRKLDRIPSFYQKSENQNYQFENDMISQKQMSKSIELQKQQLLNKFMEIKEKERRMNASFSPKRHTKKVTESPPKTAHHKKIGLVRNLNGHSVPIASKTSKMKFNSRSGIWEGNDIELMKFEDFPPNTATSTINLNLTKPGLITSQDFDMKSKNIHGNMFFDLEQLKWININHEDELDIFGDLPNLDQEDISPNRMSSMARSRQSTGAGMKKSVSMRGVSQFTQRTTSTNSTSTNSKDNMTDDEDEDSSQMEGYEFNIPDKLIEKFEKEEAKINKKIKNWFNNKQHYRIDYHAQVKFNHDYFWEIRKMVVEDDESSSHEYVD